MMSCLFPKQGFSGSDDPLRSGTISSSCFWRRPAAAGCFCLPVALSGWRDATNGLKQKRVARANGLSPGHGRPVVQLRFETELTAEEYVSREAWRDATFPPCLQGRSECDCGLMRHGTYGRKTPVPMRVARFDCRDCQTTISRLPDFAAARRRGSLQEIEDDMVVLAEAPSRWAAAKQLFPQRDELSNAIRGLCGAFAAVSTFIDVRRMRTSRQLCRRTFLDAKYLGLHRTANCSRRKNTTVNGQHDRPAPQTSPFFLRRLFL